MEGMGHMHRSFQHIHPVLVPFLNVFASFSPFLPLYSSSPSSPQEMFQRVYGVRSSSNNNLWLRKKLIEAVNTRPRGAGERDSRSLRSTPSLPLPTPPGPPPSRAASLPLPLPAAAAAGAEGSLRKRRKKSSAPVRACDGMKVCAADRYSREGSGEEMEAEGLAALVAAARRWLLGMLRLAWTCLLSCFVPHSLCPSLCAHSLCPTLFTAG